MEEVKEDEKYLVEEKVMKRWSKEKEKRKNERGNKVQEEKEKRG